VEEQSGTVSPPDGLSSVGTIERRNRGSEGEDIVVNKSAATTSSGVLKPLLNPHSLLRKRKSSPIEKLIELTEGHFFFQDLLLGLGKCRASPTILSLHSVFEVHSDESEQSRLLVRFCSLKKPDLDLPAMFW